MKEFRYIIYIVTIMVGLLAHHVGISHAGPEGINASMHDMSVSALNLAEGNNQFRFETYQSCVFCHTPHGANSDARTTATWNGGATVPGGGAPAAFLWNRDLTSAGTYAPYTSNTLANPGTALWGYSLLCMSCHDGVTAINVLHNQPNDMYDGDVPDGRVDADITGDKWVTLGVEWPENPANLGGTTAGTINFSDDHPVSIDYTVSEAAPSKVGAFQASTVLVGSGFVSDPKIRLFPLPASPTEYKAMECSTCHDVHNEGCKDAGCGVRPYQYPFLVVTNQGSFLCTSCHNK